MSKTLEAEMEQDLEKALLKNHDLEQKNEILQESYDKLHSEYLKLSKDLEIEREKSSLVGEDQLNSLNLQIKELETENEALKLRLREKDAENQDLRSFYHKTLEDLAITGSELDYVKNASQENSQRMKDHINELQQELELIKKSHNNSSEMEQPPPDTKNEFKFQFDVDGTDALEMIDSLILTISSNITEYKKTNKLK
mgnify:CR=1 FL=1